MAFCGRQYTAASPVVAIKPPPSHHSQLPTTNLTREQAPLSVPSVSAGKKRPRDEASHNIDPYVMAPPTADKPDKGWIHTRGAALTKPDAQCITHTRGHFGNQREEKSLGAERPELRSSKSQRMDPGIQQSSSSNTSNGASPSRPGRQVASVESSKELVIDDSTLHLGIGWRRLSDDQHMQAAARGWARFIGNHFALTNVRMCLESKGLQSYLVEASEGFFLFAENLRHGRLVSRTVDGALRNLQSSPPTFDGAETLTMEARDRPPPSEPPTDTEMKTD
ncbi:hypothetical protein HRG_007838 [Hirsutella rhossiliensis]|uniref:Uncharacterized protein n=1 Tax=Hirsutella rhossiliensis TaxID=111463 RepID=A0A9P8MSW4_9HYPO|nr:uncharacterized protein HRG_07838 [Hirsutella rhossiliensis]KAH0960685.1 hypothetical protein HRG_07838 [Hirsutella rhossiliensis]